MSKRFDVKNCDECGCFEKSGYWIGGYCDKLQRIIDECGSDPTTIPKDCPLPDSYPKELWKLVFCTGPASCKSDNPFEPKILTLKTSFMIQVEPYDPRKHSCDWLFGDKKLAERVRDFLVPIFRIEHKSNFEESVKSVMAELRSKFITCS